LNLVADGLGNSAVWAQRCTGNEAVPRLTGFGSMNAFLFRVAGFGLLFLALPAIAEEAGKIEGLQRVIDAQERQLTAQQCHLGADQEDIQDAAPAARKPGG